MTIGFQDYWERFFQPREYEGAEKRMSLGEAVRRHVRPGMTLHIAWDAQAAMNELVRQFYGQRPSFTVALSVAQQNFMHLVGAGLVKRVITSNLSNANPTPAPSKLVGRLTRQGQLEVESWSLYGLLQRFMAGALGLEFIPTRSIGGSGMAEENRDTFATIASPFSGERWGLLRALRPDLSIVHGLAADPAGNTIPVFREGESFWGARASRGGVIVTVEKVATTQFIREHSAFVKIPSYMVQAVCEVPFGAHPQSLFNRWVRGVGAYVEDVEFSVAQRRATDDPEALGPWLQEHVLGCPTHDAYLEKLGQERLAALRREASDEAWYREVEAFFQRETVGTPHFNATEMMVVAAARRIQEAVRRNDYRLLLTGIGVGGLATYLAFYQLRDQGHEVEVMVGPGPFGHLPRLATLDSWHHLAGAKITTDALDIYGVFLRGEDSRGMGVLGAAVVDKHGNINSTWLPNGTFLIGSGGSNDVVAGAPEALAVVPQSAQRLVDRVTYVSVPGQRVRTLVTDRGIMEKNDDGEFILTACFPGEGSLEVRVQAIREHCGWDLKVSPALREEHPPTVEELALTRALDVRRQFLS